MAVNDLTASPGNSRSLVTRTLSGEPVGRPVAGPLAVHYCAGLFGVTLRQYTTDPRVLADCVIRYHETFEPDAVWVSADTWVTAESMGATVGFAGDDQPMGGVGGAVVRTAADIERIRPPDPSSQGRMPLMLEAVERVARALGDDVFVVACFDQYPFSAACALMGIEDVMLAVADDPPLVEALMERCLEYAVAYATALGRCGAHLLSGGDSPAVLLGPDLYRTLAWPFERRLVRRLHESVPQPVSLHVCGDSTRILRDMACTGADVLEIDHEVDLEAACEAAGPEVGLWGNLDTVGLLARGRREEVADAARRALATVERCGHGRFVLSSGCTLAPETPPENVRAMMEVVRQGWSLGE